MRILPHDDGKSISVAASYLAGFARTRRNPSRLVFSQTDEDCGEPVSVGKELSYTISEGGVNFIVTGCADAVFRSGTEWYLEKVFEKGRITKRTRPASDPSCMALSVLLAHMLCLEKAAEGIHLRISFRAKDGGEGKTFQCYTPAPFLKNMCDALFYRALPFIEIETEKAVRGIPDLCNMPFPYRSIREAQRDFISEAYRAAKKSERLLVCAPTGVGKTVSALYPALRAVGAGIVEKVFYLTAKTVTGKAAADAVRAMTAHVPTLRCVTVLAKERVCPMMNMPKKQGVSRCRFCPLMGEVDRIPYEERRDAALLELLKNSRVMDTQTVCAAAKKHELCPYELSLDISEYAEVVICDYNYVFDPSVRIRRYFKEKTDGKYMFLIDEAHNLPDRAREMYSATLDAAELLKVYKKLGDEYKNNSLLTDGIGAAVKKIKLVADLCRAEEREMPGGISAGYYISSEIPKGLPEALSQFVRAANAAVSEDEALSEILEGAVQSSNEFLRSVSLFDRGFVFYAELYNGRLTVSSRCLDPSPLLDKMMNSAVSSVLFSATLTPADYFADVLGCRNAKVLELDSPYDPENLCLFAVDSVSTRYEDRESYAEDVAEIILSVIEAKEGNYIVYFPSYEYMKTVYKAFSQTGCDARTVIQSRGMSHGERNAFLSEFSKNDGGTLVGFCVLGGAFSEGVDLKGEKLIGTVIVGTGMPKITAQQNILKEYFDSTRENGHEYAYVYPAMIKVLQAAGRVIRSETDRGVAVLVDDRYADPAIYRLFPRSWRHIKYTSDPYSLNAALERFWEKE
ncbi:MAG: ATP-dependent DNA helicase [Clostridia bacterium]|nr:ATP-dependent DNA helicase [Clostridia bacterium]